MTETDPQDDVLGVVFRKGAQVVWTPRLLHFTMIRGMYILSQFSDGPQILPVMCDRLGEGLEHSRSMLGLGYKKKKGRWGKLNERVIMCK